MPTNPERLAEQRIRAARAGRPAVDHNGHPVGMPASFVYDDRGHLLEVVPAATTERPNDGRTPRTSSDLIEAEIARARARTAAHIESENARRQQLAARPAER